MTIQHLQINDEGIMAEFKYRKVLHTIFSSLCEKGDENYWNFITDILKKVNTNILMLLTAISNSA